MSTPYDIEPSSPNPKPGPPNGKTPAPPPFALRPGQAPPGALRPGQTPPGGLPHGQIPQGGLTSGGRASDLLRQQLQGGSGGGPASGGNPNGDKNHLSSVDRPATRFDDMASGLFWLGFAAFVAALGYLLYGVWGGTLAGPVFKTYPIADQLRLTNVVSLLHTVLLISALVCVAAYTFLFYHEEFSGYVLLGTAALFQLGVPLATTYISQFLGHKELKITQTVLDNIASVAVYPMIPGALLIVWDIYQRIVGGLQQARIKKSALQFGQNAVRDTKTRNVLMGPCWQLPYCREAVRVRCPVFIAKKGPCWRTKRGCQCDQSIQLLAQAPNWKQAVSATVGKMQGVNAPPMPEMPQQPQLSWEAKKERCRQCVIYNTHQEHKYKVLVGLIFAGMLAVLVLFNAQLLGWMGAGFAFANHFAGMFQFKSGAGDLFAKGTPAAIEWAILGAILLVMVSKVLQFVEYCCFTLKI